MKKLLCLLLFSAFSVSTVTAVPDFHRFSHIRTSRESSNLEIRCIFRDSDGFVWFGTSLGLLRYNGTEIVLPTEGIDSPLNDFIGSVQEDAEGRLWILVNDERYIVYDRHAEHCREDVAAVLCEMTGRPIEPEVIHIDGDRNFWIASDGEFGFWDVASRTYCPVVRSGACDLAELEAVERRGSSCYLLYASGAVEVIDTATLQTSRVFPPPIPRCEAWDFDCLYVDSHDHVWITDYRCGLWCYDPVRAEWIHFGEHAPHRISNDSVRDVVEDERGNIWIATDHGGINIYDCATGRITLLVHDPYDRTSLTSNSVYSLYRDADDNIWVGYYKRGVSLYGRVRQQFFAQHIKGLQNRSLQDDISTICEDADGNLWFGTDEFGVVRRNRMSGEETFFRAGREEQSLGSDVIVCLYCDVRGRVWIGTFQGGLSCYDHGRMRRYALRDGDAGPLSGNSVWAIDEDCDGNIWIGTLGDGVWRFDPRTERFTVFSEARGNLSADYVLDMCCRRGEQLYVSTVNGIEVLDVRTSERRVLLESGEAKMMDICRDSRGLLWIVEKHGGVTVYDTREERYLDPPRGLEQLPVRSVIEDDNKNIWLATDNGFHNIIVGANPVSGEYVFSSYCYKQREDDRWQEWTCNVRAAARTRQGEILFGSVNGYYTINPNAEGLYAASAGRTRAMFTTLRVNNTEICVDSVYDGRTILRRGIAFTDRIDLGYRQNRISLEFSSLDYASPFRTEYFYRLEGLSDEWLPVTGKQNMLTFNSLSPGEYRIRICTLNPDGSLGEDAAALAIVVHPPFWRTTAACLLYLLLVVMIVWGAVAFFLRRQRYKLEMQRAEMETERQNELNEMKIRFFTNISHDFRTPLSLIITPLEELRSRADAPLLPMLNVIHRNALRLLHLVNQLLDFRKLDVYGTTLDLSYGDFVFFVREICSSFELFAEDSHIQLSVESSVERLDMAFDKDKLSKVFMNLLSNAFKYTPGEGRVTVRIGTAMDGDRHELVAVSVCDTGIGIADADKPRIFDRFYQVNRDGMNNGSGIGLHIVREFIALHGGSITVCDNEPQGSVFRFVLPVSRGDAGERREPVSEPAAAPVPAEKRPAILLVEDNCEFRSFMRECLAHDSDIFEAGDGQEALQVLKRESIDLIISDVMMPRMDGLALCKAVKDDIDTSHIPVILLTARAMQEHEKEGLAVGADDYIAKPFNLSILRMRISKMLEWAHRSHEIFRRTPEINPSDITITSLDERLIANALKIIEENMDNSDFSVEDLSSRLGMHRTHLYKKLTAITGKSPLEFIRIVRLKRAAQLLEKSQMNISEIAYMVGFNSPKIFTKYFREVYNCSPRDYQRSGGHSEQE